MKTVIIFDVDNTIYYNREETIPKQTFKLLNELAQRDDVILGLATGRGLAKLSVINEILGLFTYKILMNGSVIFKDDQMIYNEPIKIKDIEHILELTEGRDFNIGMVGINDEAVNYWDDRVGYGMKALRGIFPKVDPTFYKKIPIYQLWIFADYESQILKIAEQTNKFRVFPWHRGGADFTYPHINKAFGIKHALKNESYDRLICIGDGANDIEMLELADISIAMGNTRFEKLKEKATYIAPSIEEDKLYDFFKLLNLFN
jgi:Cof subfamily protein (haloacid dehalogenase superfamily)